jgi:hypothetical protein
MISRVAGGDARQHLVGAEREAVLLVQRNRHCLGAGEPDDRFVDRKAGVGIEDLGPRLAEHEDGEEHRHLAARHDQHLGGIDGDMAAQENVLGHRLAQRQNAVGRGIAVMAVAQRLDRRLDDMGRRQEVGLADAEVDDGMPGLLQRLGLGQHVEGGFGAEPAHGGGDAKVAEFGRAVGVQRLRLGHDSPCRDGKASRKSHRGPGRQARC